MRALAGHAGVELRILLAASGAHHLRRVVGWPIGAVAIDDTLYVNAAWLVALAPGGKPVLDGAIDGAGEGTSSPTATATAPLSAPLFDDQTTATTKDTLRPPYNADAGTVPPASPTPQLAEPMTLPPADACSTCAEGCSSCDAQSCADDGSADTSYDNSYDGSYGDSHDTGGDACANSSDDSGNGCDSSDETSGDSCNSSYADSGNGGGECQLVRTPRNKKSNTWAWMVSPLAFLFFRRPR